MSGFLVGGWYAQQAIDLKDGRECCSRDSLSFHYVNGQLMRRLYLLVYACPELALDLKGLRMVATSSIADPTDETPDQAAERLPSTSKNVSKRESLEEWAVAARKSGRVNARAPTTAEPSARRRLEHKSQCAKSSINNTTDVVSPHTVDLSDARARAKTALLEGNFSGTLDMCQEILQEWPSDATTLLYQGAAMSQKGEGDMAWDKMERVLALASGVEEVTTMTASVGYTTSGDDEACTLHDLERCAIRGDSLRAAEVTVPLTVALEAAACLAIFARDRTTETLDPQSETFFLVEGLLSAVERDPVTIGKSIASTAKSSLFSSESIGKESEAGKNASTACMTKLSSSSSSSSGAKFECNNGESKYGESSDGLHYSVEDIAGFTHQIIMMAQALERTGQLTSSLRLYQRAILLGEDRDQRGRRGLGSVSRRLLELERERALRPRTIHVESPPAPPSFSDGNQHRHQCQRGTGASSAGTSGTSAYASIPQKRQRQRRGSCEWDITHPRPGQVFSPEDVIMVEYDLTLLDPGMPTAGSLFESVTLGVGANGARGFLPHDYAQQGGGASTEGVRYHMGVVVCSYLEGFTTPHCLPRSQLNGVGVGWHLLTAEAYQLPSLRQLSCAAGSPESGDGRRNHRCVIFDAIESGV